MLEKKEQVVALVKQALADLGLKKNAHIDFYPLLPDSVGVMKPGGPEPIWQWAPTWVVELSYPTDDSEPSQKCSFQVDTSDFQNESDMRAFVAAQIEKQTQRRN